jgi:hypothetical protein
VKMKRFEAGKIRGQIFLIPTIGIIKTWGIWRLSFAWLNLGWSIVIRKGRKEK